MAVHSNQTTMSDGTIDAELTTLARDPAKKLHLNQTGFSGNTEIKQQSRVDGWHTDSSYEVSHTLRLGLGVSLSLQFCALLDLQLTLNCRKEYTIRLHAASHQDNSLSRRFVSPSL